MKNRQASTFATSALLLLDIETESLTPTRVHCVCTKDYHTGKTDTFLNPSHIKEERRRLNQAIASYDYIVMHNGIQFDVPVLKRLCQSPLTRDNTLDTLVLSRLGNYDLEGGHSLDAWGKRVGLYKGSFDAWHTLSQQMLDYCENDVAVLSKVLDRFMPMLKDSKWTKAIAIEHSAQWICRGMHENGFPFDYSQASSLLDLVKDRMATLSDLFASCFPPTLEKVNEIQFRTKPDGSPYATVEKARLKYPRTSVDPTGTTLVCYDYVSKNMGSPKDRIDVLWSCGWKPFDKTKGHNAFLRLPKNDPARTEEKEEKFTRYGWTCSEENLSTLPEDAPEGARALAEWLCLEGRRSSLVEWMGCYSSDTESIHGTFDHIGAWTGRLAHRKPNEANIPSSFHGTVVSLVDQVKSDYDARMRSLWRVREGWNLVGTDADGIQLRVLAHCMKSQAYVDAIVSGKKEDETDIHNVNKRALGLSHITRDDAKTFIYAFLLGAGIGKVASILRCSLKEAQGAVDNFLANIEGLSRFKSNVIPIVAERGYFLGVDGRKVRVPSEHKTLAGMLQNGESTIMKHATRKWIDDCEKEQLNAKLLTFPHDEWQTAVEGPLEHANRVALLQREAVVWAGLDLELFCPLLASSSIGKNWAETH